MTDLQRAQMRASEIRTRLNELGGITEYSEEQRAEVDKLTAEYGDLEVRQRALMVAGDQPAPDTVEPPADGEDRERRELRQRARLSSWFTAVINGTPVAGAEAEVAAAYNTPAGSIPFEMIRRRAADDGGEVRTRAVTPAPSDANENMGSIVHPVFDRSASAWLGIAMPQVGVGDAAFPSLSTSVASGAGVVAKSGAADESAGAFSVTTTTPRRLTGSFRFAREDAARLRGLEEALRLNLEQVLVDELDDLAINGSGADPQPAGLLSLLTDPTADSSEATFASYISSVSSHVDGLFAASLQDVRVLVGVDTIQHMQAEFPTNQDATSAWQWLAANSGGVRASRRIAAKNSSNVQQAIIRKANPVGDAVASMPIWNGVELIRDPYSAAAKGEVSVTAVALVGDVVLHRSGAFAQDSFTLGS